MCSGNEFICVCLCVKNLYNFLNLLQGNLALSRALGDFVFKKNDKKKAEEQIVTGTSWNVFTFKIFLIYNWDLWSPLAVITNMYHHVKYFSFHPVLHDWYNKAVVCAILSGMVHIKEPLLLIGKSSPCSGNGFPLTIWVVLYPMSDAI